AEVAVEDTADPRQVALVNRLVQADQLVQSIEIRGVLDVRRGDAGVKWPARRQVQNAKQEHRSEHQGDAHFDASANEKSGHAVRSERWLARSRSQTIV